ncbi:MAG TPA: IPT/TIG domain-containing protein, partial [Polyangia bacterium]
SVVVQSDAGPSAQGVSFRYLGPPRLRSVHPTVGPTAGGIKMTIAGNDLRDAVKISFGASSADARELLVPITHEADDKVTGCLPPGHGTVTVWATDPITGQSRLDAAFTYTDGPPDPSWVTLCDPAQTPAPAPAP